MGYLDDMWWHQCNDFHGSLWLSKNAKECCHCGFKQEDVTKEINFAKGMFRSLAGGNKIED